MFKEIEKKNMKLSEKSIVTPYAILYKLEFTFQDRLPFELVTFCGWMNVTESLYEPKWEINIGRFMIHSLICWHYENFI